MMDELARYNKQRWEELAAAGVEFSRPMLNLTAEMARRVVDPEGMMDQPRGGGCSVWPAAVGEDHPGNSDQAKASQSCH